MGSLEKKSKGHWTIYVWPFFGLNWAINLRSYKMALVQRLSVSLRSGARCLSSTKVATERIGSGDGSSGWKWDKGGVGMGGKDAGKATEIKEAVGKGKDYQVPEFFKYNPYSYFDLETAMVKQRNVQPKSGATEFW